MSVIIPRHPIEIAFSHPSSSFTIQQNVRMPLLRKWGMNNRLSKLKNCSKFNATHASTRLHPVSPNLSTISSIPFVSRGMSSTPSRIHQKGSNPVMQRRKILNTSHIEQNVTAVGSVSIISSRGLSLTAPQTVMFCLLCFLTNLANQAIAVGLGVFNSIFIKVSGNSVKRVSRRGIAFYYVFMTRSPPKAWIYFLNLGKSAKLVSFISIFFPVVLLRLASWCTTSWLSLVQHTSNSNIWLHSAVFLNTQMVFSGPSKPPPRCPIQKIESPSTNSFKTCERYRCLLQQGKHRNNTEMTMQAPGMISQSQARSIRKMANTLNLI